MTFEKEIPADQAQWATYCEDRNPVFKVHAKKSLAYSAYSNKRPDTAIAIYELEGDKWVLYKAYDPNDECDFCKGTFKGKNSWGTVRSYRYLAKGYYFNRPSTKNYEAPVVCRSCRDKAKREYEQKRREEQERKEFERLREKYQGA